MTASKLASMFRGDQQYKKEIRFKKYKASGSRGRFFGYGLGTYNTGITSLEGDPFSLQQYLGEIGRFNPLYVEPAVQRLMERSVIPRLGLLLLGSAMAERQYVVEGGDDSTVSFLQEAVDHIASKIVKAAPRGIWYGWQGWILDWGEVDGYLVPTQAHDVDPLSACILEDDETNEFAGIRVNDEDYDLSQAVKITWQGYDNNHYGMPQALTVYPYWYAHSNAMVMCMRYYQRSVDPVRLGYTRLKALEIGDNEDDKVDLSELVADALDALDGGDSFTLPLPDTKDDAEYAKVETLNLPDRSDTFLKLLTYLEQKMLVSTLSMPGIGVSSSYGDLSAGDSKTAQNTQTRVLEYCTEPVIELLNQIVATIHEVNEMPGFPPRVRGGAFKRDQDEKMSMLLSQVLKDPIQDPTDPTKAYRPADAVRWDRILRSLNIPGVDIEDIATSWEEAEDRAEVSEEEAGGRPREYAINPDIASGHENGHESRPEERLDDKERAR